jgi:hypothetical protein
MIIEKAVKITRAVTRLLRANVRLLQAICSLAVAIQILIALFG